ncbi:MAG: hypothetical protein FJZ57_06495, partial [Chlamydiae bacterium]|nr:hypothetical protein [Chlamydiota bacterium]
MKQFLGNVFIMVPRKTILIGTVLLYAFLTGLTQNILFSVPIARFLQEYSSDLLPVTYIGLGFTMFVLGWTFDYIQKKSSLFISIAVPIGLFSMMQFMFSWMLSVQSTFLIIPVLIGSILIVFFTGSVSSILYYQLFTTYELKRLYGCFCGAFGLGGIVMGFCMEILLKYMDPNHLMNIGSILMLMAFGCLFIIKKFSSKKLSENVDEEKEGIKEENESFQNKDKKYVFKIFILTGVSYFIYYIFDYVFNSQVKVFYGNDIERTIFYGHFYATVDILSLVVSFFIYPWLFIKFGQKGAFLSFPILMSVLSLGAFIVHLAPAQILWAFYIIILATIVLESFLESVVLSSMLQFFQPLKKNLREWAQFKNEMIVVPTSIFIVGVILYCLNFLMKVSVENLLLVAVAISIGMIVIYFTYLEKGYVSLLLQAVTKNMFSFSRSSKIGKEEIIILEKKLSSARPEEVVHALQMLENVMPKKMDNYLKLAIRTANADVKMYCLKKIFRLRINSLRSEVKSILENDKDPHVVGSAILTYSSIIKSVGDEYFEKINGSNPEVASSIISSYLAYGGASSKERAKQKLIEFSNSEKIEERIIAAKIIGNFFDRGVLLKLLKDPYDEVRRVACDNCNQVDKEIIRCVVDNLMRPHLKSSCIAVILRYPNIAFEE